MLSLEGAKTVLGPQSKPMRYLFRSSLFVTSPSPSLSEGAFRSSPCQGGVEGVTSRSVIWPFLCVVIGLFAFSPSALALCCQCALPNNPDICIQTASAACGDLASSQNTDVKDLTCLSPSPNCKNISDVGVCLRGPFDEADFSKAKLNQNIPNTPPNATTIKCCHCTTLTDPKSTICINTPLNCGDLQENSTNKDINKLTCSPDADQICKPIAEQGTCIKGPIDDTQFQLSGNGANPDTAGVTVTAPTLNISIPSLEFSSVIKEKNGVLEIPFFAQYVAAIYRFLLVISSIACAIMIMYGGFKYILASTGAHVKEGQEVIKDALIGLVLVLSAYTILQTINPTTLSLNPIQIRAITQKPWEIGQYRYTLSPAEQAGLGPDGPASTPPDAAKTAEIIKKAAKEAGVDGCVLLAICEHETGLKPNVWSGQQSGTSKEKATAFGACQIAVGNILSECPPSAPCTYFSAELRSKFADFPPPPAGNKMTEEEKGLRRDWLLNNVEGNAYIAAKIFKGNGGNELYRAAGYGAGLASLNLWAKAHGCTPKADLTIKQAVGNPDQSLQVSCIPHLVAIPTVGDSPKGCPDDKYECPNAKINARSEFEGTCPSNSNQKCYAMLTDSFVQYLIKAYPRMVEKYQCEN